MITAEKFKSLTSSYHSRKKTFTNMSVDHSLARGLSKNSLSEWILEGELVKQKVIGVVNESRFDIKNGRPASKVINKLHSKLIEISNGRFRFTEINDLGSRRFSVILRIPVTIDTGFSFLIFQGEINGRGGKIDFEKKHSIEVSQHVLERLHLRLGAIDPDSVLPELFSAFKYGLTMFLAAENAQSLCWPLWGLKGLFVAAPSKTDPSVTCLVTWMRFNQLGIKWGRVAQDIRAANRENSDLLQDVKHCTEILRLHSWLKKPHQPKADIASIQWDWWKEVSSRLDKQDSPPNELTTESNNITDGASDYSTTTNEARPGAVAIAPADQTPGLNYFIESPPFSLYDRILGTIVKRKGNNDLLVALGNGWFGLLPRNSIEKTEELALNTPSMQLGSAISVEITRIKRVLKDQAFMVSLELTVLADENWKKVEERYPIGSISPGIICNTFTGGSTVSLPDGTIGFLPDRELSWSKDQSHVKSTLEIGKTISVKVVGSKANKRRLQLSLREAAAHPIDSFSAPVNSVHSGTITNIVDYGVFVRLPIGIDGLIHKTAIPNDMTFNIGDEIKVIILEIDYAKKRISLKPDNQ